jgi:RNA polymerase sigma factor (sigma-70 family)
MDALTNARLGLVVERAADGDEDAWRQLVGRFTPMLRGVARGFRLSPADVDDAVQVTWSRAFTHIRRLHEPEAIGGWLAVTARRECLRLLQRHVHEILIEEATAVDETDHSHPEAAVLGAERLTALRAAVSRLPEHQRRLLAALLTMPGRSYEDVSAALGMPVGSIGPTRNRSLDRLRSDRRLVEVLAS